MSKGEGGERRGRPERRRGREGARERRGTPVLGALPELFRSRQEPTTIHAAAENAQRADESQFSIRKPFSSIYNAAKIRPSVTAYVGILGAALATGGTMGALTYGLLAMPGVFFKSRWRKAGWLLGSAALLAGQPVPLTAVIGVITIIEIIKYAGREYRKSANHQEDYGDH